MFRRQILTLIISLALLLVTVAPIVRADDPPGAKLFATYCSACHGTGGEGGFAPPLGDGKYLNNHSDDVIAQIISEGAPGKGMPAWSKSTGGSLTDEQIADIVTYLHSLASATSSVSAPATTPAPIVAAASYAQTKMTVTQSTTVGGNAVVEALLQKNDGTRISGAPIAFVRVTMYGSVSLGTVKTDNSGIAALVLSTMPEAAREVDANFKGDNNLGSSASKIVLQPQVVESLSGNPSLNGVRLSLGQDSLLPPEGSLITPNPPLVPTAIFALVVACVWATYAYVVSQVVGIWKSKPSIGRINTLTIRER